MKISTKGRYAVRVMLELACHDRETYVPLEEIARYQDISKKYLEAIMTHLVKDRLVVGLRGKGGGYRLARTPETYTVGSILRSTEGSLAPVACMESGKGDCARAERCATISMWQELYRLVDEYFEGITLEDLKRRARNGCEGNEENRHCEDKGKGNER